MRRFARSFGVLSLGLAFSLSIGGLSPAPASPLLFDRGLPTINLNELAGTNRSNVCWADGYYYNATPPTSYNASGDDFSIGSSGSTYHLDKITVWTVDELPFEVMPANLQGTRAQGSHRLTPYPYRLLGGLSGEISQVSISARVSAVTYVGLANYQGISASYPIYQVDFKVDWTVAGGQPYQFFIDAPLHNYGPPEDPAFATSFLHASNKDLSGSTQEGADNLFLLLPLDNGVPGIVTSWDSLDAWGKSSDANVRIYGTPIPLPGTLLLLGSGLAGLGLWRLRRRFKA